MTQIIRGPGLRRAFATGSTYYYMQEGIGDTTLAATLNRLSVGWFRVDLATTFDSIATSVTTAGAAGAVVRLGVYAVLPTGLPGALILDAGTVNSETTGAKTITISLTLQPGYYLVGGATQVVTCTTRARLGPTPMIPQTLPGASNYVSFLKSSVTGALPDPFGAAGLVNELIKVELRAV